MKSTVWLITTTSRDDSLPELEYYVTEWNTLRNGDIDEANNRGLQQVSMNIEIFYEMVTHNVTAAHFWPSLFDNSNSGTLVTSSLERLTIAGEGFALMSESLVGLTPVLDFFIEDEISIHGYGDDDTLVFFLSERSGAENVNFFNFSDVINLDAEFYQVSWTELWDGGAGGQDKNAQPVISETQVIELMTADEFENFLLTMQPWSIMRLEVQAVDDPGVSESSSSNGEHSRYVQGSDFDDHLRGGLGRDSLHGESGTDTLWGLAGFDLLDGGAGDDLLDGGAHADNLFGGAGNDTMRGGDGLDRLFGGIGDDFGRGGAGDDGLFGEAGNDTLHGEDGNDRFFGGVGDDLLYGGEGTDTLYGGAGFDTLTGGAGDDLLYGNFNADRFVFADGHGNDTIADFEADNPFEKIDLRGVSEITDTTDLIRNHAVQEGRNVVIDTGAGNSITLNNVNISTLGSSDFIF